MATPACPYCGASVSAGSTFCGHCGRALAPPGAGTTVTPAPLPSGGSTPAPPPPGSISPPGTTWGPGGTYQAPPAYSGFPPGYPIPGTALSHEVDGAAMGDVVIAAVVLMIGLIVGLVAPNLLGLGFGPAFNVAPGNAGAFLASAIYELLAIAALGLVISLVGYFMLRRAFLRLRPVDHRFQSSPTYALAAMIGLIILLPALAGVLLVEVSIINCAGSTTPIPPSCLTGAGGLAGAGLLLLVGAIIAIVGYIGTLVSIWRLGTRYNDSMFKVGAVLLIFPYLNIVGVLLLIFGARSVQQRIGGAPPGGLPGPTPYRPL